MEEKKQKENLISIIIKIIGLLAIIFGAVSLFNNNQSAFFIILTGILLVGFAEIIRLLNDINNKLKQK